MKFRLSLQAFGLGIVAAAAAFTVGTGPADAQGKSAQGSAERGKVLAYTCHGCHGVASYKNAYPTYSVPKLGGQSAPYLVNALRAYASGERSHPTMHAQAASMTDQDRADIAAFLQSERVHSGNAVVGASPPATQTCVACHGVDGATPVMAEYPILAGQYEDYIVQALHEYKSGQRKNPVMGGIVSGVKEQDFAAIARFFSQQPGLCGTDVIRDQGRCDPAK